MPSLPISKRQELFEFEQLCTPIFTERLVISHLGGGSLRLGFSIIARPIEVQRNVNILRTSHGLPVHSVLVNDVGMDETQLEVASIVNDDGVNGV
jgi:hypothetical protein